MNKKLLIGIIVVIVVFVITVAILRNPFFATTLTFLIPLAVWIYLVWMVRKKKVNLFHDQVEPKIAERRLKMLKALLLVAGISLAVSIVGMALHGVLSVMNQIEEPVSFYIALVGLYMFIIATQLAIAKWQTEIKIPQFIAHRCYQSGRYR